MNKVLNVLKEKTNGFYLELGAGWPTKNSNTYLLESEYGWSGVSFENDPVRAENYNLTRKNKTLSEDAISFDYLNYFLSNDQSAIMSFRGFTTPGTLNPATSSSTYSSTNSQAVFSFNPQNVGRSPWNVSSSSVPSVAARWISQLGVRFNF